MYKAEWMINTRSGPAVGDGQCYTLTEARRKILNAFTEAMGPLLTSAHEEAIAKLELQMITTMRNAIEEHGRWEYRVPAIALTVTATSQTE